MFQWEALPSFRGFEGDGAKIPWRFCLLSMSTPLVQLLPQGLEILWDRTKAANKSVGTNVQESVVLSTMPCSCRVWWSISGKSRWCSEILAPFFHGSCLETILSTSRPRVEASTLSTHPSPLRHITWRFVKLKLEQLVAPHSQHPPSAGPPHTGPLPADLGRDQHIPILSTQKSSPQLEDLMVATHDSPTVGETNIGMAWEWLLKVRTAPPHRSQGFVLHLGPHGRWAEVPTLQLLTEQVQNLVSWAKSKVQDLVPSPSPWRQKRSIFSRLAWHLFLRRFWNYRENA